jgi:acetyl-CoA C-acetyltransferase
MREAVILSTARTGIGKAFRGSLNMTHGATMGGHALEHAVKRAGIEPGEVEDLIMGCGLPEAATGGNIARQITLRAGLPVTATGATINRFCSSGLQAIAMAGQAVVMSGSPVMAAGGLESISITQANLNPVARKDPWLEKHKDDVYLPMIDTADNVAHRYGISREAQDEYGLQSQMRTAAAQQAGRYAAEIVPMKVTMGVKDKETGEVSMREVTLDKDECNRPTTTLEALAGLEPVRGPEHFITAGNASQLSDGASACILMEAKEAEKRGFEAMGALRGFVVAGCEPDEMGIGPVFAVPRLLERTGLKMDDIGLWELNEAFASQVIYSRDKLGIPDELLNVDGGSISIGHPYGMSGSRMVGHALIEGKRRGVKYAVITMCIGGGQGAAGLLEIF